MSSAVLVATGFPWRLDEPVPLSMSVRGTRISASAGDTVLTADDDSDAGFAAGGMGLLVADGAVSVDRIRVSPG